MAMGDVLTLRVVGRYQSQNIVNTLHYQITAQGSSELVICKQLVDGWDAALKVLWAGRHIDTYQLVGLKCFRKTGVAKTPHFKLITQSGAVSGTEVPSPVCRTITLYTASSNPKRRGRVMLSGTEAAMLGTADGAVTAAEVALLNTMATTLLAAINIAADTFEICIPATGAGGVELVEDSKARVTPSMITTRRIRQFLIG